MKLGFERYLNDLPGLVRRLTAIIGEMSDKINNIEVSSSELDVPIIGEVKMWPAANAPTKYLLCQGQAVSRLKYSTLFKIIGTTYGVGDGSTTFNIPNFTGLVPRMPGTQAISGRDKIGPALGATQEDQVQKVTGTFTLNSIFSGDVSSPSGAFTRTAGANFSNTGISANNRTRSVIDFDSANSPDARVSSTTDGETRVSSLGINFIIKAL